MNIAHARERERERERERGRRRSSKSRVQREREGHHWSVDIVQTSEVTKNIAGCQRRKVFEFFLGKFENENNGGIMVIG